MAIAEATVDASRRPSGSLAGGGWYDPDSIVFQAVDDDRVNVRVQWRPGDDDPVAARSARGGATD